MSDTTTTEQPPTPATPDGGRTAKLISASAVMAAGTALSRVMGFFRLILLVFLFGNGTRQAEMFTIANTVPNSMYILLAGGVLNTVLVPQIVRAIRSDADRGEAYTNRIMTAGLLLLALITLLLTLAVPLIIRLYTAGGWKAPGLSAQYDSMIMLGYYCMPQVFFYGVHVLAGQVLNARDRFGPMMWAPITNNVVSILVLLLFLIVFGRTSTGGPFTPGQELLLGLGSTLGIMVQAVVLIPFLRSAGYHFSPRWDFRHTGLGKTFRLAKWTLGFVLVSQAALVVVSKLATGATVGGRGGGLTAYYNAYAVWILPHSLITVSLATAMLPAASRFAAAGDRAGVAAETMRAIRLAVTALLPTAVGFIVLGLPIAHLVFGFGRGARDAGYVGGALMALAIGLVPFTIQYICLRAFYALEDNRTTFFLQCLIAGANVGLGSAVVLLLDRPPLVATGLAASYSAAYLIGVVVSFRQLRRRLPELNGDALVRHCVRLLLAIAPGAVAAWLISWTLTAGSPAKPVLALVLALSGLVAVGLFLIMARLLKIREVAEMVRVIRQRRGGEHGDERAERPPVGAGTSAGEDDLGEDGDSPAAMPPPRGSIESTPPPANAALAPSGPTENAESMAQAVVAQHIAASLPAGTVLASRYRLEELISESGPTVTWRAFDQVLSRSVLVHLLAPAGATAEPTADQPGEAELLAAARRASVATDSRFVRVLDAVQSTDPDLGSYIVCEYTTGQSLAMILSHAPLSGLEAAWVVREVADALAGVHSLELYHRRINPDTVIITPTGNVKIVGLLIEAALRPADGGTVHGASTPELVDVTDLGRLLYACLVSRWPGGPAFSLPAAPVLGRHWGTPRQVRAGVSPALDNVCDQILGDPPRHRASQLTTAHAVVTALTKVLGSADASGDLERRLKQPIPLVGAQGEHVDATTGAPPVSSLLDQPAEPVVRRPGRRPPEHRPPLPRPLAAADARPPAVSASIGMAGKSEAGVTTTLRPPAGPGSPTRHHGVRTRRQPRRWIGLLIALVLLLVSAGVVSARLLDRRLTAGFPPVASTKAPAGGPTTAPPAGSGPLAIARAREFDPQGDEPKTENPDEVKFAYDKNPKTRWRTVQYLGNPKLGGIKRGVGLIFDLGTAQPVRTVALTLSGTGTTVEARVPAKDPATVPKPPMGSDRLWRSVAKQSKVGGTATLTAAEPVTTRFVLVYLTSLPKEGRGYRGGIYEVEVRQ